MHSQYECETCGEKMQEKRNCDGSRGKPKCQIHGEIEPDETYEDKGVSLCIYCDKIVKFHFNMGLGGKFMVHRCPVMLINPEALFLIDMVNACTDLHSFPEPEKSIYDQSNLFMEARKFILSEQRKAYEEIRPKEDAKPKK